MSYKAEVDPKPGDLIEIFRPLYQHWAIYIGDGDVIHLAPECEVAGAGIGNFSSVVADCAVVKREPLWKVVGSDKCRINNKYDTRYRPRPVNEIITKAKAEVGKVMEYSVFSQNCEHFVTAMRYDIPVSDQVTENVRRGAIAAVSTVGIVSAVYLARKLWPRREREYE